jgi:serine/threonine-protein kinase
MTKPFDAAKLQLAGEPVPVAEHVGITGVTGIFSVSNAGVLAYRTGANVFEGFQVTWFDREGKTTGTFGQPGNDQNPSLSPDAARAAVRDAGLGANGDIWLLDFARGVRTRLTFRQSHETQAVWSSDGTHILFSDGNSVPDTLFAKAASGAGEEKELLKKPGEVKVPTSWSHDGRFLLYHTPLTPRTGSDLWVLPLEGHHKPVLLLGAQFNEANAIFSPDERWIAYTSDESGRYEVYVRPFVAGSSEPTLGEGKWQVSKDGASGRPKWRADGKEILFPALNGSPMAVDVAASGAAFQMGTPKQLFAMPANSGWDATADGKRFLATLSPVQQNNTQTPITVVLNWQAVLKP